MFHLTVYNNNNNIHLCVETRTHLELFLECVVFVRLKLLFFPSDINKTKPKAQQRDITIITKRKPTTRKQKNPHNGTKAQTSRPL